MCSFGDFAAISDVVDEDTAMYLKKEVSDGIIAAGYTPEALEILKSKKKGNFIVLEATPNFVPPSMEYREVFGMAFSQKRNDIIVSNDHLTKTVTKAAVTDDVKRDMILGCITLKYTQSNSVGFCKNGQMIGVGAGQQSRVDCVKLAGRKVATFSLRQHEQVGARGSEGERRAKDAASTKLTMKSNARSLPSQVLGLQFKAGVKRQDRVNARVRYIEGDFTAEERVRWEANFDEVPAPLTAETKAAYMDALNGVILSSDAFFPFRDGIDHASKVGVR